MSCPPGLQQDCERLLDDFQATDSIRFETFAQLWRQRRFHSIFHGKIRPLELNKFTKKALDLARQYFLPPYTFQIRVGALYLLYGLYNTQLCQPKQKIRISLRDWPEVQKFQQDLVNAQHYDAAYVYRKLRLAKAFHFTAMPKLLSYRVKKRVEEPELKEEFRELSNRVSSVITSDTLEEFMNVHNHYQKMKCMISTDKSQPDKALSLVKNDFVIGVKNIILEYQQWQQEKMNQLLTSKENEKSTEKPDEGNSQESEGSERASALAKIKQKSYAAVAEVSKSRRHRQVKLESSESGSDQGKLAFPKDKRNQKRPQPTRKRSSPASRGVIKKETISGNRKLSVIPEEDSSSEEEVPRPKRRRRR
ncbi:snRNA-activating protein complex subunit 1 isoform X1 [Alligator mississippiensis]|uniref:snRNA-activating protein complex subunit 1 n=1 Tax=Alligator mississippiensis TaxID=8496 RepID=A0A151N3E0_ALLMI|nr:snRNA-activating protein complex subunit 1 isoform X1 [Alligator mississippiensis]KYO31346.1 snRNA-activating protein complex subunit 1 [Alligator mississippiensis]